ncbi:30S ribosomal protein S3 [Patescibacteria group bacterium]|nr:30S ribosomal protein S3 [Patescibacteria group bacterium]MBU4453061.1 30S ribosomal protein S3 [Patescibacteria group bacterium]MCG2687560.1 30S ribosomal protein S3 [Candidatus Parcubacteria bacterium]
MGHKIHPKLFRLSTIYQWDSKWFGGKKNFIAQLQDDVHVRDFLKKELREAGVDLIEIDRNANKMTVTIHAAKPGVVIGRSGAGIEELRKKILKAFFRGKRMNIIVNVQEVAQPALSARVVGLQIAQDLERRLPFRRSMKMASERVMKAGAKGVKIMIGGRLNGADIARTEQVLNGSIPLHNLRADINFARIRANTIFGVIGIKVWIYRGEVFDDSKSGHAITNAK